VPAVVVVRISVAIVTVRVAPRTWISLIPIKTTRVLPVVAIISITIAVDLTLASISIDGV
jgi:hypothetical protein